MTATAELNFNFRDITPPKTSKSQLREAEKRQQGHNKKNKNKRRAGRIKFWSRVIMATKIRPERYNRLTFFF